MTPSRNSTADRRWRFSTFFFLSSSFFILASGTAPCFARGSRRETVTRVGRLRNFDQKRYRIFLVNCVYSLHFTATRENSLCRLALDRGTRFSSTRRTIHQRSRSDTLNLAAYLRNGTHVFFAVCLYATLFRGEKWEQEGAEGEEAESGTLYAKKRAEFVSFRRAERTIDRSGSAVIARWSASSIKFVFICQLTAIFQVLSTRTRESRLLPVSFIFSRLSPRHYFPARRRSLLPSLAANYSPRSPCDAERKKRNSGADLFRR